MLAKVAQKGARDKLYACEVRRKDQFERKNGGGFDAAEFEAHPERYVSNFAKKFAPYASVIVNGIYWAPNTPRLLTIPDAKSLLTPGTLMQFAPSSKGPSEYKQSAQNVHTRAFPRLTKSGAPSLPHRLLAICDISADPGGSIEFMNECTTIDEPFCLYDADMNQDNKILLSDASQPFEGHEAEKLGDIVSGAVITSNG